MSTDNKDEIILEGSEEQSIEAKRNKIDFVTILEEANKEEAHTWHDELVKVKERYDNFDIDKMCARCIKEQHEQGIKDVNGELTTTIQCSGVYSFKNETIAKHGEDIYKTMVSMMTEDQLEAAETTVNPLKWMESAITDKKMFEPRPYQALMSLCSAKYKVLRCGRRCIAEYEPVLLSDGRLKAIKDIEIGDSVVTYYKGQAINKPVTDKIENGVKEVFRITLNDNRTVDCTSNHPLLLDGREWKSIEQGLKVGDKVTTLTDYHLFGDYSNVIEAKLLGYLLADGYIPDSMKQTPKFTSCTPAYIEEVRSLVEEKFGYKCNVRPRTESAAIDVYLTDSNKGTKNKVKEWLKDKEILGVKGDKNRKILNYISKYDKESFGYFVNRLWSGDGCVSLWTNASRPNGKRIEVSLTTSNKDLADTLKAIFIKLNINARVAEQRRITNVSKKLSVYWKLIIGDSISIKNFFKLTGPIYGKEQNSKEALIEIEKRKYTKPVANSKFFDKRIKKIEKIGDINTYDISVADTHNFVVNGIVTHNTGKSYTMTVGMLHRLLSRNNYRVLMVAPMETMITEIVELIVKFCNAMEENPIVRHTQSPIHNITFNTGSTFKGVTAGASGAKAVRGKGCVTDSTSVCIEIEKNQENLYFLTTIADSSLAEKVINQEPYLYTVYETKNKINNKVYVGYHSLSNGDYILEEESDVGSIYRSGYLGSGKLLKEAIVSYGPDSFSQRLVYVCDTKQEAEEVERSIVNEEWVKSRENYNISLGGNVCVLYGENNGFYGKQHTPETISKIQHSRNKTKALRPLTGCELTLATDKNIKFHRYQDVYDYFKMEDQNQTQKYYALCRMVYNKELLCKSEKLEKKLINNYTKRKDFEDTSEERKAEYKKKMSAQRKGRKLTEAQKAKLSENSKKWREENKEAHRELILDINKNPEKIRKTTEKHRGMKRSLEAKINMALSQKGFKRQYKCVDTGVIKTFKVEDMKGRVDFLPVRFKLYKNKEEAVKGIYEGDKVPEGFNELDGVWL